MNFLIRRKSIMESALIFIIILCLIGIVWSSWGLLTHIKKYPRLPTSISTGHDNTYVGEAKTYEALAMPSCLANSNNTSIGQCTDEQVNMNFYITAPWIDNKYSPLIVKARNSLEAMANSGATVWAEKDYKDAMERIAKYPIDSERAGMLRK